MENLIISSDIKAAIADLAGRLNITEYDVIKQAIREYSERIKQDNNETLFLSSEDDPFFSYNKTFEGDAPEDGSVNHDKYLYEEDI